MAKRKETAKIAKVTLNLYESDWEFLKEQHSRIGAGKAVRMIVQGHVERLRKTIAERQPPVKGLEVEME